MTCVLLVSSLLHPSHTHQQPLRQHTPCRQGSGAAQGLLAAWAQGATAARRPGRRWPEATPRARGLGLAWYVAVSCPPHSAGPGPSEAALPPPWDWASPQSTAASGRSPRHWPADQRAQCGTSSKGPESADRHSFQGPLPLAVRPQLDPLVLAPRPFLLLRRHLSPPTALCPHIL